MARPKTLFMDGAKGMPNKPFTPVEHREKLDELTFPSMGEARAIQMYAMIDELDPSTPLSSLIHLLRPD